MKIYNYDSDTFEYLYACDAEYDPAELAINHKKVYLIPANATKMKPPKTDSFEVAIWNNNNWKIEPDYRNNYIINEFLEIKFIQEIGAIPAGYFPITPEEAKQVKADPLYYIVDNGKLVKNPNYDAQKLEQAKEAKLQENDTVRDTALNAGVTYKNVLFDSDTDQKVNLLATVSMMGDENTITWFGKDNQSLECNKEDLLNIGNLIIQLHSFCWNKNALIKNEIAEASTYAELDAIEINYELLAVEDINGSNGGEQAS